MRISGVPSAGARVRSCRGTGSYTVGTTQSCNWTGLDPISRVGLAANALRAAVTAAPSERPATRCAYRSATNWAAVTT